MPKWQMLGRMDTYDEAVTRAVLDYLDETGQPQKVVADAINQTVGAVNRKIRGHRAWSLRNVQALHERLGIEVPLPALVGAR